MSTHLMPTAIETEPRIDVFEGSLDVIAFTFVVSENVVNESQLRQFLHSLVFEFYTLVGPEILPISPLLKN